MDNNSTEIEQKKERKKFWHKIPLISKLKNVKHIEFIVAGILSLIVLVIFLSSCESNKANADSKSVETNAKSTSSIVEYTNSVESKLAVVLSGVKGCSNVKVMVVAESSPELVLATNVQEKEVISGDTTTRTIEKDPIFSSNGNSDSSVVVVLEKAPKITGVLVVANGVSDGLVKLNLISAIQSLFDIDANCIQILEGC